MNIRIFEDAEEVAVQAARFLAEQTLRCQEDHGLFIAALSGGRTPWKMLDELGADDLPWQSVHLFQVDERIAPAGHTDRNLVSMHTHLPNAAASIYPMPVEADDLEQASRDYSNTLQELAGERPVIDLLHLGMGADGHCASLVPGDPVLDITDRDVAVTQEYQGRRRMTLTYPIINRARTVLWLITGADKRGMLARLLAGDKSIPAGRVSQKNAVIFADNDAAS